VNRNTGLVPKLGLQSRAILVMSVHSSTLPPYIHCRTAALTDARSSSGAIPRARTWRVGGAGGSAARQHAAVSCASVGSAVRPRLARVSEAPTTQPTPSGGRHGPGCRFHPLVSREVPGGTIPLRVAPTPRASQAERDEMSVAKIIDVKSAITEQLR
jgi:hypothetical protein